MPVTAHAFHILHRLAGSRWKWRTPLHLSQPYWEDWYQGLSDLFTSVKAPKVLVLAGTDRLDKSLTIGQMQGKFQLVLLPQVSPTTCVKKQWLYSSHDDGTSLHRLARVKCVWHDLHHA